MDFGELQAKINEEVHDSAISRNYTKALYNTPSDFKAVIEQWVNGCEGEYSFKGISLSDIRKKEECSYLKALLRMQILINNPSRADGYLGWTPIQKDWGR